MLALALLSSSVLPAATALVLKCLTCPDSPVSCECQGSMGLIWTVTSTANGDQLLTDPGIVFELGDERGQLSLNNGFTGILCSITDFILYSKLTFNFSEDINITCQNNLRELDTVSLQRASSPSPPINLSFTLTPTTTDSFAVRLDWDPPVNHGGVAITNYLIFVNMSQQVVSTDTTTTLTLNSTGQHLIETSAVNKCGLVGDHVSIIITTDFNVLVTTTSDGSSTSDTRVVSTSAMSTTSTNTCAALLTLNSGGVVGVVTALLVAIATTYTCGILTGFLVWRKKNHTPSASGDLSAPAYEQVLPPSQTNISLKENEAYGHFNS